MIEPSSLTNREESSKRAKFSKVAAELEEKTASLVALRKRIAELGKIIKPIDPIPHCGDCYRRGWAAALRELEELDG